MAATNNIPTPNSSVKPLAYAWVILAVLYLASVAAALNQFKVPPILPLLINAFNMSLSEAGMLMSVFSLTGFILALPAGFIMQRLGLKLTGLIAVAAVIIGSGLGAFCSTAGWMLGSRFVEGAGIGLLTIVAPAAIAAWFPAEKLGTPMGLWSTCMPVGNIVVLNLAPRLAEQYGWNYVWKAGALLGLATFILFWIFFRMPRPAEGLDPSWSTAGKTERAEPFSFWKGMANASLWLITVQFLCYNLVCLAMGTYYPTFLNTVRGYSLPAAAFVFSLATIAAVFSQPVGGYISDRLRVRKLLIVVSSIVTALIFLFPFVVTGWMIPALILMFGLVSATIVPPTFAAVPEVMGSRQLAGLGMSVLALGQNIGMLAGPIMFGKLAEAFGWEAAGYLLIPVCAIGVVAVCLAKFR